MAIQVGKADYKSGGGDYHKVSFFKLGHKEQKQRTLVLRFAPPIGPLADSGVWNVFLKQHWGYRLDTVGSDGKPHKRMMNFKCIEKTDRNKNIVQHCPECDLIKAQKDKRDAKKAQLEKEGKSPDEINSALEYVSGWLSEHNLDKKFHIVAKTLEGNWGFFQCSYTAFKFLKSGKDDAPGLIEKLVAKGKDPLSPEKGIWIRWERTGSNFREFKDIPAVYTETVEKDGEAMERIKYDTLTQADLDALEKLPALDALGTDLSFDQIKMLVDSGGDEDVLRTVFNMPKESKKAADAPAVEPEADVDEPAEEPAPKPTTKPEPELEPKPEVDDEEAALLAQMAALKTKKAAQAAAVAKTGPKPAPKAEPPAKLKKEMESSDEDMEKFLEDFR
jgi:hypothetical protein